MAWVVDTSVLIDVLEDDPRFGKLSARTLDEHLAEGLVIAPVSYVELAPAFNGQRALQEEFLSGVGVRFDESWTAEDTATAFDAWHGHVQRRRRGEGGRRPVADVLIGAFASRFDGLVTRNCDDFRTSFPALTVLDPTATALG